MTVEWNFDKFGPNNQFFGGLSNFRGIGKGDTLWWQSWQCWNLFGWVRNTALHSIFFKQYKLNLLGFAVFNYILFQIYFHPKKNKKSNGVNIMFSCLIPSQNEKILHNKKHAHSFLFFKIIATYITTLQNCQLSLFWPETVIIFFCFLCFLENYALNSNLFSQYKFHPTWRGYKGLHVI